MEFATMEENAANYFASMSHLASKMMQYNESVREMYRDTWEGLSWEKQEELIDQHTIDPKIADKYASCRRTSEPVNCFPVLKINSGEKIVVDFEHDDGWTWTDEHSAPFSWKTKSQQDLTLLDLEDTGNSKEEHPKKNRIGKKSCSPDRGMFDTAAVAGDRSKNEVEKMFEKFGIKVPVGSDDEDKVQESSAEVITKDPDSIVSPSHLYNEHSKLLDDLSDVRESKDFVFSSDAALFDKSEVVRRSTSKQNNSAVKKEPKTKSQGGGGVKKEKSKTGQGKVVKEKMTKKKKASVDSVDSISKPRKSSSGDKVSLDYCGASREDLEMVPGEITFTRPNHVEAVSPIRFAEIGESSTDNLKENQEDGADTFVFSPSDLTSGARFNDVFDYSEVKDDAAAVVTSQPKKFELDLDAPFATSAELVEAKRDSVVKTGFDFLDNW